jgi:hypothetical protein
VHANRQQAEKQAIVAEALSHHIRTSFNPADAGE